MTAFSIDVAKLVAVLAGSTQAIDEIYGIGNVNGQRLPLVQLPTTAGTGSEVTNIAIVTTDATTKTVPHASGSDAALAEALIVAMQQTAKMTGIETRLRQVGITEADLDRLADDAMRQTRLLGNNPRALARDDARAIYAAAL